VDNKDVRFRSERGDQKANVEGGVKERGAFSFPHTLLSQGGLVGPEKHLSRKEEKEKSDAAEKWREEKKE